MPVGALKLAAKISTRARIGSKQRERKGARRRSTTWGYIGLVRIWPGTRESDLDTYTLENIEALDAKTAQYDGGGGKEVVVSESVVERGHKQSVCWLN